MFTFGKYILQERIAEGGMGEIYLARLPGLARPLALKRILPDLADEPRCIQMFIDEAYVLASLRHKNIVEIIDLGAIDGVYYLAMEYVTGLSLDQVLASCLEASEGLPLHSALYVAREVANGLAFAHSHCDADGNPLGIVHRDISPQNILLSISGEVKIIDFGIAKAFKKQTQTVSGTLKGKLGYMSPEQARGEQVDHRADIFSLGAVLQYLVTRQTTFRANSVMDLLKMAQDGQVWIATESETGIPSSLEAMLRKALASSPWARYSSAADLGRDIDALLGALEYSKTGNGCPAELVDCIRRAHFSGHSSHTPSRSIVRANRSPVDPRGETANAIQEAALKAAHQEATLRSMLPPTMVVDHPDVPPGPAYGPSLAAPLGAASWMGAAAGPIDDADLSTDVLPAAGDGIVLDLSDVGPGAAESISSPAPEFTSGQVSSVSGPPVSSPIATELDHNLPEPGSLIPDALAIATDRTMLPPNGPLPGFDSNPGETLWTSEVRVLDDIPHARRSGMELAGECGMSKRDAMRIGTVISDLARTVLEFSEGSELRISRVGGERNGLRITFSDLTDVVTDPLRPTASAHGYRHGMGMGISAARKLVDHFSIQTDATGRTVITAIKYL